MIVNSYFWSIKVYTSQFSHKLVERFYWGDYTLEQFSRWKWYFKYRAALLQIKYPRYYIRTAWGPEPATRSKNTILKARIRAKKAKITQYSKKLKMAKDEWNELFPISENELYIKANQKIERLKRELNEMQIEIQSNSLTKN
ncbi:hypothetical protein [Leeuwenhoekiella marinoflava]|uniref:Uncharacterized protein n=2 Tax=Leeuwenhoekiella marinoflava TaxID=988 RepID=A0A4V1KSK2_9FLAO|nr:hypothetical protein [Leeuwenhoekiella marinoflava]RXG32028.1 hypothetical protein DSL99_1333 [Leeuwenhoekiella marinoflava]SHE95491.1 hypothetical protein SAMN02745246_01389 [Leeuwenhoekiella marinoflava DSM 3653]